MYRLGPCKGSEVVRVEDHTQVLQTFSKEAESILCYAEGCKSGQYEC